MGSLIGFFLFSFVADNYGRKIGLGAAWFMATLGSLLLGVFELTQVGIVKSEHRDGRSRHLPLWIWHQPGNYDTLFIH